MRVCFNRMSDNVQIEFFFFSRVLGIFCFFKFMFLKESCIDQYILYESILFFILFYNVLNLNKYKYKILVRYIFNIIYSFFS